MWSGSKCIWCNALTGLTEQLRLDSNIKFTISFSGTVMGFLNTWPSVVEQHSWHLRSSISFSSYELHLSFPLLHLSPDFHCPSSFLLHNPSFGSSDCLILSRLGHTSSPSLSELGLRTCTIISLTGLGRFIYLFIHHTNRYEKCLPGFFTYTQKHERLRQKSKAKCIAFAKNKGRK